MLELVIFFYYKILVSFIILLFSSVIFFTFVWHYVTCCSSARTQLWVYFWFCTGLDAGLNRADGTSDTCTGQGLQICFVIALGLSSILFRLEVISPLLDLYSYSCWTIQLDFGLFELAYHKLYLYQSSCRPFS